MNMLRGSRLLCFAAALGAVAASIADNGGEPEARSLLGQPLFALPHGTENQALEKALAEARQALAASPEDLEKIVWVGRRLGYLWRMRQAVEVFTQGIQQQPDHALFYRHRGHRHISRRQFKLAVADLEKAARLMEEKADQVEPDGMPNERNIPLTTTGFNVWYHLGLAHYLLGDFEAAVEAYRETLKYSRKYDDNLVATTDWLYMALRRLGRDEEAAMLLESISAEMEIIENHSYHRRLLLYKGVLSPEELLSVEDAAPLELATLGYGLGNWYYYNDDIPQAMAIFRRVVDTGYWPAFGAIAAEVELARQSD